MPTDRYTNAMLTVIAASLVVLTIQNVTQDATAQQFPRSLCPITTPCYVTNTGIIPLNIIDVRAAPTTPSEHYRGISPKSGQPK